MNVIYEPTITLGTIIQLTALVVTILVTYGRLVQRLTRIETQLEVIWKWYMTQLGHRGGSDD